MYEYLKCFNIIIGKDEYNNNKYRTIILNVWQLLNNLAQPNIIPIKRL